jgi:hypothetical protein
MDITFIKTLQQEWPTVSGAPWSFAIISAVAIGLGFGVATLWWSGTVSTLRERLSLYQDRLQGASPDEAKARIDTLEERVRNTIGSKWEPLTRDEITKLTSAVSGLQKRMIQIMYSNYLGRDLAESIANAFRIGGWGDMSFSEGSGLGVGVSTGLGNGMAVTLKGAIESSTKLQVRVIDADKPDNLRVVFVAVGIRAE